MPNPFLTSLQPSVIISLQSLLCNKQSFQPITLILLYPFHTLASLSITLTSNNSRHSPLLCVSHSLSFSFLLSLSWMGVNRQRLFNTMPTPSTHASHSISHFPSENQTPLSPSSSFSFNHLHNHSFSQFLLNASCFLPSLLHSPFSSFLSLIHSPSLSLSIPILPFKIHPHYIASLSSSSNLFSIIHTFHSHSSFQIPSSSQCISLSRFSNPFSVSYSFHSHSSFQNQSSSHCISLSRSSNPFSIIHTFISSRLSIFQS